MTPFRRRILVFGLKMFDLFALGCSLLITEAAIEFSIHGINLGNFLKLRFTVVNIAQFSALVFIWHLIFDYFEIYQSRRLSSGKGLFTDIIKATTIGTLMIFAFFVVSRWSSVNYIFMILFWCNYLYITLSFRIVLWQVLKYIRKFGRNLRNIIIVGTNKRAINYGQRIKEKPELGYRVIGFVDYSCSIQPEFRQSGYILLSDMENFPSLIREHAVDEVVVSLPLKSYYEQITRIVSICEQQGIIIRFFSDMFEMKLAKAKMELFDTETMLTIYTGGMQGWPVVVKRMMDFMIASVLLLILSPLLLITALLIKIDNPGPAIFVQERLGLNKRHFRMYKFRTMHTGAESIQAEFETMNELNGPVFKIKNDPRITRLGRFLRKTSIDELPQLFNVIKGDISLVGPRPLPVRDYRGFNQDFQRRRFSVHPGITCLWQISGRNHISFDRWMEMDMEYIDNWSLWLDLKILVKTLPAVIKGTGAS